MMKLTKVTRVTKVSKVSDKPVGSLQIKKTNEINKFI